MTDNIENLILEHLRAIRADIGKMSGKIEDLTTRTGSLEDHVAGMRRDISLLHNDIAITHKRLDTHEHTLDRIGKRLELHT